MDGRIIEVQHLKYIIVQLLQAIVYKAQSTMM